jgi:hypothetical protein
MFPPEISGAIDSMNISETKPGFADDGWGFDSAGHPVQTHSEQIVVLLWPAQPYLKLQRLASWE